ncbi:MAG: TIGR03960 family B12-binding radical SAM protein [Planctomycetes bacterium]|nr:TIGR03960 family B12-binding radical SAM protein [Planctomycetota bacterium]
MSDPQQTSNSMAAKGLRGDELRSYLERHVLPHVTTPAQYTGGELNQTVKPHEGKRVKVALAFPDTYAMGMSSTGFRILYHVWNLREDYVCERVFAPWPDMEAQLRAHGAPLYTLETFTPVVEYDVLAFSVAYEMGFTNMLTMLDLAGIPLKATERTWKHPLVLMGGHTAFAPEPIADYVDAFCIGEGEELALDVTEKWSELKRAGLSRDEALLRLCREVPGVYVPRFYGFQYFPAPDNTIADVVPLRANLPFPVKRRVVHDLENAPFPTKQIVPFVDTVFDRYNIEIMRGCVNGCRFCQAGMITRTQRQRSIEKVVAIAKAGYEQTGYDEIGLLSLSSSDYYGIADLARQLNDHFEPLGVSVGLPSLRMNDVLATLPKEMSRTRKSGLTIAPEAATERLRNIINKPVKDEHLINAVREAFKYGFTHVKLYFMCGLPGETDEDLRAIGEFSDRISRLRQELGKPPAKVSASVSSFVPKAGTPFQWAPMLTREEWRRRQRIVMDSSKVKAVRVKVHDPDTSYLEGLFSRGDRRLGAAIETAWRNGARFDGWDDQLKMDVWNAAFAAHGIDADWVALRERPTTEIMPWVVVSDTVSEQFLKRELRRASEERITPTCTDTNPEVETPCFICDACEKSPLFAQKEAMLAAPVAGKPREERYARNWQLPEGARAAKLAGLAGD